MSDPLLDSLNPAQLEAVTHRDGPLLVLAGAGSGKTRVITHRIAWLLREGVAPRRIVALTFTNKAADEMRARIDRLVPGQPVWTSTFHRFCARLLRQHAALVGLPENYTIYDTEASQQALRRVIEERRVDMHHLTPERVAAGISWAKNNLIPPERYEPSKGRAVGAVVAQVYPAYAARLLASAAVDFDDLLLHVATLLRENAEVRATLDQRYGYILVDEYQDTNLAQYAIIRALSNDHPNLAVTGDPDQSIYGWRGANLSNILDFEHDYPTVRVVKLERNYRSTKNILHAADRLIAHNLRRKPKGLYTENDAGAPVRLTPYPSEQDEAESIAGYVADQVRRGERRPRDFAVFYRTNALSRPLETALRLAGVPYQMVNGLEFYQRKEVKDMLAYLHLLNNPRDDVALLRVINAPARGIGKTTLARLREHAADRGLTLLEAAREAGLVERLSQRAAVAVARFVALFDRLSLVAAQPVEEILGHVLELSGYRQALADSEDEFDQERLANVEELLSAARQFDEQHPGPAPLESFLELTSLVNDTDAWEVDDDRVTLMTLHASKGLEFPVVFIVAVEEGLLPHDRSRNQQELIEEERRLLFVGMTRAQRELHLSLATYREYRGQRRMSVPSQFLMELPLDEMNVRRAPWTTHAPPEPHDAEEAIEPLHADELEFNPAELEAAPSRAAPTASLTTAAHLAGAEVAELPPVSPDVFRQGMLVVHPEYGLGKVLALSGTGARRSATVAFISPPSERKFMLAKSRLRPAQAAG